MFLGGSPVVGDVVDGGLEFAAGTADEVGEGLLDCGEETTCFVVSICGDDVDADHRIRVVQLFGRFELATVDLEGREERVGGEV